MNKKIAIMAYASIIVYAIATFCFAEIKNNDIPTNMSYATISSASVVSELMVMSEVATDISTEVSSDEEFECPLRDSEIDLLAALVVAEAETECEAGKRLVIDTVLNRIDNEDFPDCVVNVIFEPNQYPSMTNVRKKDVVVTDDIRKLVKEECEHRLNDEVLYFNEGGYFDWGTPLFKVQNHYFSKD